MRILHLSWEYPPVVYGGLGRHVHALAQTQAELGHDVVVITQAGEGAPADEVVNGVRIIRVSPVPPAPGDWRDGFLEWTSGFNVAAAAAAIRLYREWSPDVAHVHDWLVAQAAVLFREACGVPVVLTVHATESGRNGGVLSTPLSKGVDAIEAWIVGEADRVIVCSEYMRTEVVDLFDCPADRIAVIPNGIDPDDWRVSESRRRSMRRRYGRHTVGYSGRLEPEKGVLTLIDAMAIVRRAVPDATAVVIGSGGAAGDLKARVRRRRLGDVVTFAGYVSEEDLRAIMGSVDVAVVPSLYEPFGFVALEAMALGTPLVASRTGGLATIVEDGVNGLLVHPGDPAELAEAITGILQHPTRARRRAAHARQALAEQYGWPAIATATEAVYRSAVRGGP